MSISLKDINEKTEMHPDLIKAFYSSGLMGNPLGQGVIRQGFDSFNKFGTQWDKKYCDNTLLGKFAQAIELSKTTENENPPGTMTTTELIRSETGFIETEQDSGWIAQLYIRPNPNFYANPNVLNVIGPSRLKLTCRIEIDVEKPMIGYVYPNPEGDLALVMLINPIGGRIKENTFDQSYDIISPILDELAFKYDQQIPIAHHIIVGIPSGKINTSFPKPAPAQTIVDSSVILKKCSVLELEQAIALYREGISSNQVFHQFLTFWRVYENILAIRAKFASNSSLSIDSVRSNSKFVIEKIPDVFAFREFQGRNFAAFKDIFRKSYRDAIAHGALSGRDIITGSSYKQTHDVSTRIPFMRYIARTSLSNTRLMIEQYKYNTEAHELK